MGKKWPGRDADPSPPFSAVVKKEYSYTSTPPMGRTACTEPQCLHKSVPLPYLSNNVSHIKVTDLQPVTKTNYLSRGNNRFDVLTLIYM